MKIQIVLFSFSLFFVISTQRKMKWDSLKLIEVDRNPQRSRTGNFMFHRSNIMKSRIVGGMIAREQMFPYQVALNIVTPDGNFFCGGSLISKRYILTAGHCVENATLFGVLLGTNSLNKVTPGEMEIITSSFIRHPDYNPKTVTNDIALINLMEDVPFSDQISSIDLPSLSEANDTLNGQNAVVSGWGKDSDLSLSVSPVLRYVSVNIIRNSRCETVYGVFPENDVCVSGIWRKGACSGDSGGPLTTNINNQVKQVGIVSFGSSAGCQLSFPSGYTKVSAYLNFIGENSDVKIE